jgi:hypothetical protein
MAALSADVSADGFCLEVMRPIRAGTQIDGYVLQGDDELDFRGEVIWAKPAHPEATHWSRVGVRFTWLSDELRDLLL